MTVTTAGTDPLTNTPVSDAPAFLGGTQAPASLGTVLVLGARGRLGYSCVQAFAQAGWRVLAHVNPGGMLAHKAAPAAQGAQVHWIDNRIDDAVGWQQLQARMGQVHTIVHTMGTGGATRSSASELLALIRTSIAIARQARATLVLPLTVLPLGRRLPHTVYEDQEVLSVPHGASAMVTVRAQLEMELRQATATGLQVCAVRAGVYYGLVGEDLVSTTVTLQLPQGRMRWLGPYDVATAWVYLPDLAQTLERVAHHRHRLGPWTLLHSAGMHRTGDDWRQALTHSARQRGWLKPGQDLRAQRVHWSVRGPLGWFSEREHAWNEMAYLWRTPFGLDNSRLEGLIGREPRTDWQRSVDQTVDLLFPPEPV